MRTTIVLVAPGGVEVARWPLDDAGARCDVLLVDALARVQLAAARLGCSMRVCGASRELCELLELAGLRDVVRVED